MNEDSAPQRRRKNVQALSCDDARVGWITVEDARQISKACDFWLASRGIRTGMSWFAKKKLKKK